VCFVYLSISFGRSTSCPHHMMRWQIVGSAANNTQEMVFRPIGRFVEDAEAEAGVTHETEWQGTEGETYTIQWRDSKIGACWRKREDGTQEVQLHYDAGFVWWRSWTYYCDASELCDGSYPIQWYAAGSSHKQRPSFVWYPVNSSKDPEYSAGADCTAAEAREACENPGPPPVMEPPPGLDERTFCVGRPGARASKAIQASPGPMPCEEKGVESEFGEDDVAGTVDNADVKLNGAHKELEQVDPPGTNCKFFIHEGSRKDSETDFDKLAEPMHIRLDLACPLDSGSDGLMTRTPLRAPKRTPLQAPKRTALSSGATPFVPLPFIPAAQVATAWEIKATEWTITNSWCSRKAYMPSKYPSNMQHCSTN